MKLYTVIERIYEFADGMYFKEEYFTQPSQVYSKEQADKLAKQLNTEYSFEGKLFNDEDNPVTLIEPFEVIELDYET